MRAIIGVPASYNVSSFQTLLVVEFLNHTGCRLDVRKFSLLVDMRVDEEADFMNCLLGLTCEATAETDDVVVNKIDFIGDTVDGVDASS